MVIMRGRKGSATLYREYQRLIKVKNKFEKRFIDEAFERGFVVLRLGALDFLILNLDTKNVYIVEVKSKNGKLTPKQMLIKALFEQKFNIPVYISRNGEFPEEIVKKEEEATLKRLAEKMGVKIGYY